MLGANSPLESSGEAEHDQGQKGVKIILPVQTGKHCSSRSSFIISITPGFLINSYWLAVLPLVPNPILEVPAGNNLEIPGTAELWVVLGLAGSGCRIPAEFGNPGTLLRTGLVLKNASAPPRCVIKAAPWTSLRNHKLGVRCVKQWQVWITGRGILNLCLNFWAIISSLVLSDTKRRGREELSTFSRENTAAKHWNVLPNLTQSLKQRLWLCLAAQLPSVPSEVPILLQDERMTKTNLITVPVLTTNCYQIIILKIKIPLPTAPLFSLSISFYFVDYDL